MRTLISFGSLLLLFSILVGCGDDGGGSGGPSDAAGSDAGDTAAPPDALGDIADVAEADAAPDAADVASPPDAADAGEPSDAADAVPADAADTADVPEPPDLPRYALSLLHFNVQYVAGGLEGFLEAIGIDPEAMPGFVEYDNAGLEDRIVTESFLPVLELLDAHPKWALTLELQAYMLEIIAERHPGTLDLLRSLVERGQVELLSFHYSDQLFLAYDRESMRRSLELTQSVFESAGIERGGAVFTQEGQFGEGMAPLMQEFGYDVALIPRNLFKYQYGNDAPAAPRYDMRGSQVIVGGRSIQVPGTDIQTTWVFFDDGEKLMTGDLDPYAGSLFAFTQASYDKFEQKLLALEAEGWKIATIRTYMDALDAAGVEPEPMPPVLDGSWQPKDSTNMYRWLGGIGLWPDTEQDNAVLTGAVAARNALMAAEIAGGGGQGPATQLLADGWRALLLGQVSDSTGWNPWIGEVQYSLDHIAAALAKATQVLLMTLPAGSQVDLATGKVEPLTAPAPLGEPVAKPVPVEVVAQGWTPELTWNAHSDGGAVLTIRFIPGPSASRSVEVHFPFTHDHVVYSPGLLEDEVVAHPLSAFAFEVIGLPLANGLLGLSPDTFVIKELATVHVAVLLDRTNALATFRNESMPNTAGEQVWRFHVLTGVTPEQALERALRLNVEPVFRP